MDDDLVVVVEVREIQRHAIFIGAGICYGGRGWRTAECYVTMVGPGSQSGRNWTELLLFRDFVLRC